MSYTVLVILISVLLLAFLLFKEIKRSNKHFQIGRILASMILVIGFACMALPIYYSTKQQQKKGVLNVITEGISIDSLKKIEGKLFYTDPNLPANIRKYASYVPDLTYFIVDHPDIQTIHVYGNGLDHDDLNKVKHLPLYFSPSVLPAGFTACHWNTKPIENETLAVQGTYKNSSNQSIQIKLTGFGTDLDSTVIKGNHAESFTLKHAIRQKGKALLHLVALAGKDTVSNEILPIESTPKHPVKVLMLTSFPGFEYNFLKKWLYENEFSVALRSQISKNKYSTDFLNQTQVSLAKINLALLKTADVLIIDQEELEALSASERSSIQQGIHEGLGVILLLSAEKSNLPVFQTIKTISNSKAEKSISIKLSNKELKLAALAVDQQFYLSPQHQQQEIVRSSNGETLVLQQLQGNGKVLFNALQNTFEWILAGKTKDYASYWSELISVAARKTTPTILFNHANFFPTLNEKQTINMELPGLDTPDISYNQKALRPNQNLFYSNLWTAQSWAENSGWNSIEINKKIFSFYIFKKSDWTGIRTAQTIENNIRYSKKAENKQTSDLQTIKNTKQEVSKWFFFALIVSSCVFLWLEQRIYSKN